MKFKHTLLLAITMAILNSSMAQKFTADSVNMKAEFTEDVYYTINGNKKTNVKRNNWDIAFANLSTHEYIIANHGAGVEIYLYPKGDTSAWSSFDTTGYTTWKQSYGADSNYHYGAFNQNYKGGHPNYSWAKYTGNPKHDLIGISIYLIKLKNKGAYKKLWIVKKPSRTSNLIVKIADINGRNETIVDYANSGKDYFYTYIDLETQKTVMHEPKGKNWDIWFTKYLSYVRNQHGSAWYPVVGAFQNPTKKVAKAMHTDQTNFKSKLGIASSKSNTIGYDWKMFDRRNNKYVIHDSNFYAFKETTIDNVIQFTNYKSRSGKIFFNTSSYSTSISNAASDLKSAIFPNPNNGYSLSVKINGTKVRYTITSLDGKTLLNKSIQKGYNTNFDINLNNLTLKNGIYIVNLTTELGNISYKFEIIK